MAYQDAEQRTMMFPNSHRLIANCKIRTKVLQNARKMQKEFGWTKVLTPGFAQGKFRHGGTYFRQGGLAILFDFGTTALKHPVIPDVT